MLRYICAVKKIKVRSMISFFSCGCSQNELQKNPRCKFDTKALVDILNREKKLPITYCISNDDWHTDEPGIAILKWRELSPSLATTTKRLKKEAFFKEVCVFYVGEPLTVFDIIKFYAYCRGGIHLDKGEVQYNNHRAAFDAIKLNNISCLDHSMRAILQIVLSTLTEFRERLLS